MVTWSTIGVVICQIAAATKASHSTEVRRLPQALPMATISSTVPPKSSASRSTLLPIGDGMT